MSIARSLAHGLRTLLFRRDADRDLADEVQHYLDESVAAHVAAGVDPDEARRIARLEIGGTTATREHVRAFGWENVMEAVAADLRFALRRLRAQPAFTIVTVLTLALGIGATTAIVSAVKPILIEPLPYPEADRIVSVWDVGVEGTNADVTYGTLSELEARSHSFEALAAMKSWNPVLHGDAEPEPLAAQRESADYFRVLGVAPRLGRNFVRADDRPGGANVVVLSDALWRRRFSADAGLIGAPITLDGISFIVAGVMPRGFENASAPATELWTTLQYDLTQGRAWGHHLRLVGRLHSGVTPDQAERELDRIALDPVPEFPRPDWASLADGLTVRSLQHDVTAAVRPALLAILGAVILVLVIACVNVTNLLLAHGAQRRGEFALRAALGAGQGRLVRQLLTESLLLAIMGGALGMVVAIAGIRLFVVLSPPALPRLSAISLDGSVFAAGLLLTTLTGLAFGLMPAVHAARSDARVALTEASSRATGNRRRARSALVIAEVALALVLLVTSGLLLRSLNRLFDVDPGIVPEHLLTLQVQASGARAADDSAVRRFFDEAVDAVAATPGVASAAIVSQLPMSGDVDRYGVRFEPAPQDDPGEVSGTFRYAISPGYIATMGIPLKRGRVFNTFDRDGAPLVALVSESMARRRLPGLDPVGQRLRIGAGPLVTVVGVVGDVKQLSLATNDPDAVYVPATQWQFADRVMSVVIRASGDASALAPAARNAIWSVDRTQGIVRVATMEELLARSAAERRFVLLLFEAFAIAALVLAAAGLYGVISGSVAERTKELAVRSALGATRGDVLGMIVGQGMRLTAVGAGIGLVGALWATRIIASLLFGVSPLDAVTYAAVLALLACVALVACATPAWRALRVDPAGVLRGE
jgi:putative ABC transport system permease protein